MKSKNITQLGKFFNPNCNDISHNIYGVAIFDMISERTHFLNKIPAFSFEYFYRYLEHNFKQTCLENRHILTKEPVIFICKSKEFYINNRVKINLTIINEIIICILFNPLLMDEFSSKLLNQRLLETLIMVSNTKMIKIEILNKRHKEVNLILEDYLYSMDPRLRFKYKKIEDILARKAILHSYFLSKLKVGFEMMNEFLNLSFVKSFRNARRNLGNLKKLRYKIIHDSVNIEMVNLKLVVNEKKFIFNNSMKKFYLKKDYERKQVHIFSNAFPETETFVRNVKDHEINKKNLSPFAKIGETYIDVDQLITNVQPFITKSGSESTGTSHISLENLNKPVKFGNNSDTNFSTKFDWTKNYTADKTNNLSHSENNIRNSRSYDKSFNKSSKDKNSTLNMYNIGLFLNTNNIRNSVNLKKFDLGFEDGQFNTVIINEKQNVFELSKSNQDNKFTDFDETNFEFGKFEKIYESNIKLSPDIKRESKVKEDFLFDFELEKTFITDLNINTLTTIIKKENSNNNINFDPSIINPLRLSTKSPTFPTYDSLTNNHIISEFVDKKRCSVISDPDVFLFDLDLSSIDKRVLNKKEDVFDPFTIKNNLFGSLNEKGKVIIKEGKLEEVEYKGQMRLELKNNFEIKNKVFHVKIFHDKWNESKFFKKEILDVKNVVLKNDDQTTLTNIKELFKILTYNIDKKLIEKIVEFKFEKNLDIAKNIFSIKLNFKVVKNNLKRFKNYNLTISLNFFPDVKFTLEKTNRVRSEYKMDKEKNILIFTIKNFLESEAFEINLSMKLTPEFLKKNQLDKPIEKLILQSIILKYLYEDFVFTFNSIDITYQDEFNKINHINIIKRCLLEEEYYL